MIYIWIPMGYWTSERVQKGYILNFSPDVPCWTDSFLSLQVKDHCKNSPPELLIDYKSVLKQQSFSATSKQSSHTQGTSGSCSLQWTSLPRSALLGTLTMERATVPTSGSRVAHGVLDMTMEGLFATSFCSSRENQLASNPDTSLRHCR